MNAVYFEGHTYHVPRVSVGQKYFISRKRKERKAEMSSLQLIFTRALSREQ